MKVIICAAIGDIHIHSPGINHWKRCDCGNTAARWEDPQAGTLIVASRPEMRRWVRGLGLNNRLLEPVFAAQGMMWEDFRSLHDLATSAPGYAFDRTRAGCWAVPFAIGQTDDTRWATEEETVEALGIGPDGAGASEAPG